MGRVLVVGSINLDFYVELDRRPDVGETVAGRDVTTRTGGKGANQAVAAARAGAVVSLVGCVGDDAGAGLAMSSIPAAGVDVSGVRRLSGPTAMALILVTPDGENSIVVVPGATGRVEPADAAAAARALSAGDVLVTVTELPVEVVAAAVLDTPARVVLTCAPVVPLPAEVLRRCDPLLVNVGEARALLGDGAGYEPLALARALVDRGARSAVVTAGAAGAAGFTAGGGFTVEAPAVEVVDTTGAGDALAGTLAAGLAAGVSLRDALAAAVTAASGSVTRPGAWG